MCLSIFRQPVEPEEKEETVIASPDVSQGPGSGPAIGAKRFRVAGGSSGGGTEQARTGNRGTSALRIALSLPNATGLNVPA